MKILLLSLALALQVQPPVTVYVFTKTDSSGLVDADSKVRQNAVDALSQTLGKSKMLAVVRDAKDATIQVEVTKTEAVTETDHLSALNNALNGAHNSDTKQVTYRFAVLRYGEYSTELKGKAAKNEAGLSRAIEGWIKDNAEKLKRP